jgi:hypothetical protein
MNKKQKVAKGAWLVPFIFVLMIVISGLGPLVSACISIEDIRKETSSETKDEFDVWCRTEEPAEFEIVEPSKEPCKVTTDKYTYYVGEPVYITITGYRQGSSTSFSRGYMIKDSEGNFVRDGPWIVTMDHREMYNPAHYTWNQKYELHYGPSPWGGNLSIHYPRNGQQVSTGKYYIYACPGLAEPAEIEIVEASEKPLKITTNKYTYYQGEPVHITITGYQAGSSVSLNRGYLIKDELGNWVRDPPQIITYDVVDSWGPDNYTWYQKYELLYEYDIYGNNQIHYPENGKQVSPGKYYIYPIPGNCEPAEIEIINSSEEPHKITTDKYTYYQGEPVYITITGYRGGSSTEFHRGYLIMDQFGNWVRDPPIIVTCDVIISYGPFHYTWEQKYELMNEYDIMGNLRVHYPENGNQVSIGKYYIYPIPGNCEPAEIEIIERPRFMIEKEKISGPDEVFVHTYYEWELKITVYNNADGNISSVVVKDVLPAEFDLLEYNMTHGELGILKKGKGKMGSTHLTWLVGDMSEKAELTLKIATTRNPAGKQEFTSPGRYILNDGATAKGIDLSTNEKLVLGQTPPIYVTAIDGRSNSVPIPDPIPSQPSNSKRQTAQLKDNNALGIQNVEKTPTGQPIYTIMVIILVFFFCMFITYLEVRFTGRLMNRKLIK